jgi:hypothetical protein
MVQLQCLVNRVIGKVAVVLKRVQVSGLPTPKESRSGWLNTTAFSGSNVFGELQPREVSDKAYYGQVARGRPGPIAAKPLSILGWALYEIYKKILPWRLVCREFQT